MILDVNVQVANNFRGCDGTVCMDVNKFWRGVVVSNVIIMEIAQTWKNKYEILKTIHYPPTTPKRSGTQFARI